jgi:hypothetical protein
MTMEISSQKRPAGSALPGFWTDHQKSIEDFMMYPVKNLASPKEVNQL